VVKKRKTGASAKAATDALYRGDFAGFIGRRNELAKRLQRDGDAEVAKAVRALRKPTAAAWAVNQLSHDKPELRERLLEAGTALRDAQGKLVAGKASSEKARQAAREEREAVAELVEAAERLADSGDTPLSQAALDRIRQTLHAVALDEEVRRQFERGRLTEEHEAVGLGPVPLAKAPTARTKSERPEDRDDAKRKRDELRAAESEEREMRRKRTAAERELERKRREADRAQEALQVAADALEEIEEQLAAAAQRAQRLRG
jgi:hypothetical protein